MTSLQHTDTHTVYIFELYILFRFIRRADHAGFYVYLQIRVTLGSVGQSWKERKGMTPSL